VAQAPRKRQSGKNAFMADSLPEIGACHDTPVRHKTPFPLPVPIGRTMTSFPSSLAMYHLIQANAATVIASIPRQHVTEYDWLIQNLRDCDTPEYQARYKVFWRLGAARLSQRFCNVYFSSLQAAQKETPDIGALAKKLRATPTHKDGRKSLQFSFVTKLVHMVEPTTPIYDSLVASFYYYKEPLVRLPLAKRVEDLSEFHGFLGREYQRILKKKLLAKSIEEFRRKFSPCHFTDEKIIDSLLWAFVSLLKRGGLTSGQFVY
jgi:hypothetical protein